MIAELYYDLCSTRGGHQLARVALACMRQFGLFHEYRIPVDCLSLPHDAVRGLMRLWKRMHWSSGDGMMPPHQLLAVYRLAATWPVAGDIVELGSWTGLTTCYLATACKVRSDGKVFGVDTFAGTREGGTTYPSIVNHKGSTLGAFRERIRRAGMEDIVEAIIGYTSDVVWDYNGGPIRMLLIDADHSYEGVRQDFELWAPFVATGGLIVFHDYEIEDVARFVNNQVCVHADYDPTPGQVAPNIFAVTKRAAVSTAPVCPAPNRGQPCSVASLSAWSRTALA